ncbi:MAG: NAD(P)-dependent oxidoreductase [Cyclobacteriaceae bacterium]|nr:NAD(P)-dependent oxidoreductase [Cyclobacteriaceae bacterium]MDH4295917.1 NAD(P)-dependent oxidoreductase [Cyclobacteriaceae bacterium]MDH5247436.1 NAD(P)-dependent oxidoreductase [Cyclobacteriaceae bacterium]
MKKYLVTGGSGFIGTNVVDEFLKQGFSVLNLDRSKPVKDQHLPYWKEVDILDYPNLEAEIVKFAPDVILHLAAVTDLNGKNLDYYNANIKGTQNIVDIAAKLPSLKKVLFTSSMYVCKPGYIPKNYDDYWPHTPYGESKVKGELIVKAIHDPRYRWVIIRPTSIWGPWFNIPYIDFFNVVYHGKYFDFGKTCTKTYGYIENTVFQIQKLIANDDVHLKTFYLGDYPPIQISQWANEISIEMGKGEIRRVPFFLMRMASLVGDALTRIKIKFPITSFRLTNMTTDNILPLDELYALTGPVPVSQLEGVKKTLKWLVEYKGFKIKGG